MEPSDRVYLGAGMDVSATLDDSGTITVTAVNIHPVERTDAGVLIAEFVARLHHGLMHCDGDGDA